MRGNFGSLSLIPKGEVKGERWRRDYPAIRTGIYLHKRWLFLCFLPIFSQKGFSGARDLLGIEKNQKNSSLLWSSQSKQTQKGRPSAPLLKVEEHSLSMSSTRKEGEQETRKLRCSPPRRQRSKSNK